MERLKAGIIVFSVIFIVIFVIDYFFIKRRYLKNIKKKKKNKKDLMEINYLVNKFKLNKESLPMNNLLVIISIINAFIISIVYVTLLAFDTYLIIKFIIGFFLLIALIYAMYELLGRYLERNMKNGE